MEGGFEDAVQSWGIILVICYLFSSPPSGIWLLHNVVKGAGGRIWQSWPTNSVLYTSVQVKNFAIKEKCQKSNAPQLPGPVIFPLNSAGLSLRENLVFAALDSPIGNGMLSCWGYVGLHINVCTPANFHVWNVLQHATLLTLSLIQGCQRVVEDWQKILQVRSLVLSPQEDMKSWLKYSSLCRKSGRLALSHKTLVMLLGTDPSKQADQPLPTTYPQVTFTYMEHMWNENKKVGKESFLSLHFR